MTTPTDVQTRRRTGDLFVLLALAALALAYGIDAVSASRSVLNLILVLPLTVGVLLLCAVQFVIDLRRPGESASGERVRDGLPAMLLFAAYVLSLGWLGFDVGTFVFLCAFLWLHGERRPAWLVGYSFVFTSLAVFFFSTMLPYPMPLLILDSVHKAAS